MGDGENNVEITRISVFAPSKSLFSLGVEAASSQEVEKGDVVGEGEEKPAL